MNKPMQWLLAALLIIPGVSLAENSPANPAQPADVTAFLQLADDCQYLAGEWDSSLPAERKQEIEQASAATCGKAAAQQKSLRSTYAQNKQILDLLNQYDF